MSATPTKQPLPVPEAAAASYAGAVPTSAAPAGKQRLAEGAFVRRHQWLIEGLIVYEIQNTLTYLLPTIAVIWLVVGGIGVMNIISRGRFSRDHLRLPPGQEGSPA